MKKRGRPPINENTIIRHIWKEKRSLTYRDVQELANEGRGKTAPQLARDMSVYHNAIHHILKKKFGLIRYIRWIDPTKEKIIIVPLDKESSNE